MKVYGHPLSGCTRKVLATMFEVGLTPSLTVVDLTKGEHKRPQHTALQPFGKVPALVDDFVLYGSQSIMVVDEEPQARANVRPAERR